MTLRNEILVAKPMLVKKCSNETDLSTVCKHLQGYKEAFPVLHKLYITALNLMILAHETSITNTIDMDEFIRFFAKGNRRLIL